MKTSLTLSAVLFALTLTPAAFASSAQEQKQEAGATVTNASAMESSTPALARTTVSRSILERIEIDIRKQLIGSLREGALAVLQFAAPALGDAARLGSAKVDVTAR